MTEGWLRRITDHFWERVGGQLSYPQDLSVVISRSFPIAVIELTSLSTQAIEQWLHRCNISYSFLCQNRSLRGCIVAARGQGLLFLDLNDHPNERRFTVAHEIAHFLLDYLEPRQEALRIFGPPILSALNGERLLSKTERVDALLSHIHLGVYTNLMGRARDGGIDQGQILRSEVRADRLALELLAPTEEILGHIKQGLSLFEQTRFITELLETAYGPYCMTSTWRP